MHSSIVGSRARLGREAHEVIGQPEEHWHSVLAFDRRSKRATQLFSKARISQVETNTYHNVTNLLIEFSRITISHLKYIN